MIQNLKKIEAAKKTKFLVYIDDEPYSKVALRFACNKANRSGCPVEMLYVLEPADFASLGSVADVMKAERREKAEKILMQLAGEANIFAGITPSLLIKEGLVEDQIVSAISDDNDIGVVILGTAAGTTAGNKMLSWLVAQLGDKLHIPVMIVPGDLTDQQILELT